MNNIDQNKGPQIQPNGGKISTESLSAKEPTDLAEELEQLLDHMTEETYDADVIDAYLAALEEKSPAPQMKAPKDAYEDLQKRIRYLSAQGNSESQPQGYKRGHIGWRRYVAVIAATVCLIFMLMMGAQAAGIDVFGHLAQWTDEIFRFVVPSSESTYSEYYAPFQEALRAHEIPAELAPAWYPEGFQADGPQYDEGNPFCDSVRLHFIHENGKEFTVEVMHYFEPEDLANYLFQKDVAGVEQYTSGGRTFYILSNLNTVTATWATEDIVEAIEGFLSVDEVKQIIDSIGGENK